jgi:NAD(P)-dependent dehydrogenase (short-subunit alcohol dehydrogenase family)
MQPLNGRVALVVGASRGIGKGIALELGAAGAHVYAAGRTLDPGAERPGSVSATVSEIEALGGSATPVRCDATSDDDLASIVERIGTDHGALHALVNSVFDASRFGATIGKPFWELPPGACHDIVDVGTKSAYLACVHAAPLLLAAGATDGALIVNITALGARKYLYNVP